MKDPKNYSGHYLSEVQLLSRLADRNEMALRELYRRFWESLFLQAMKILGDEKASEDVVQEVFVDLWEKRKFDQIDDLSAYLYQAVKYKTLMTLRQNRIKSRHLTILKEISQAYFVDHKLLVREMREEISHQLTKLPPRCREVFYKSRFEHLKNDEIAAQLNISKRTVETHISHALRYLRGVKELLVFVWWLGW